MISIRPNTLRSELIRVLNDREWYSRRQICDSLPNFEHEAIYNSLKFLVKESIVERELTSKPNPSRGRFYKYRLTQGFILQRAIERLCSANHENLTMDIYYSLAAKLDPQNFLSEDHFTPDPSHENLVFYKHLLIYGPPKTKGFKS